MLYVLTLSLGAANAICAFWILTLYILENNG